MIEHPHRRSKKFINSWAQLSIAIEVVLHALLLIALISLLLFAPPFVTMFSQYGAEDHQAVARELLALNIGKWPLFIGLAIFIGIVSILFSHHIVGPAYQLKKVLADLSDRKLSTRVKFRKWDYLNEIQPQFNEVVGRWESDIADMTGEKDKAMSLARELAANPTAEKAKELEQALSSMDEILRRYASEES